MAFIDEIRIRLEAGDGGNGVVRWRHVPGIDLAGPSGGNGGKGGNVYAKTIRDIGVLARYRNIKELRAERGGDGAKDSKHGKNGDDLVIDFPVGSLLKNLETGQEFDLLEDDKEVLLLSGGRGGLGNEHFKASTNTTPKEWTPGKAGEKADFYIELRLIADAGIIGLPNAGKSSLLNALTNAKARVGNYAFTTLEPNLGSMWGYILADVPGLIEGASRGKGLGDKFLRHIRRTKIIFHCISLENEDLLQVYEIIRNELKQYDSVLAEKPELIILTKTDLVDEATISKAEELFKSKGFQVLTVSTLDPESVKKLTQGLLAALKK